MTSELTTVEVVIPGRDELRVVVDVQADWETSLVEDPPLFLAQIPQDQAGPFGDNLIVTIEALEDDAPRDLEELQGLIYAQAFSSVPDFHAVDDRPHEVAAAPGWFRASLQTAPPGITAMNRQVFTLRGDLLVTLSLTTMAFRDPEASELFDAVVASCGILSERESD